MRIVDLIEKKRDGGTHSRDELEALIGGYVRGDVPDYQVAACTLALRAGEHLPLRTLHDRDVLLAYRDRAVGGWWVQGWYD